MTWRKEKEFVCPYCKKDFNKKRAFKSHIKDAHKKSKKEKTNED